MAPRNIVVIGGGVGGTMVANLLAHKLTRKQAHITLIDRTGRHSFQPGWLYVPFGGRPPERLERAERRLLNRAVHFVVGETTLINRELRVVELADGSSYPFDDLVVATGACLDLDAIPGYTAGAHHFYHPDAALKLHLALRAFTGGRIVVGAIETPFKCPPAPIEFTFLLDDYLRQRAIRAQTTLTYLSPFSHIFNFMNVGEFLAPLFDERGISYEIRFNAQSIDPDARIISSLEGLDVGYDLLVMVPPHRGAAVAITSGLADVHGWIPTNRETLQCLADPDIYVIGDASDVPVAKSGAAAHFEAKVVAHRLIAKALDHYDDSRYDGQVMFFIETGNGQASQIVYDYNHIPHPSPPSHYHHYEKMLLNRAYWYLVPNGII